MPTIISMTLLMIVVCFLADLSDRNALVLNMGPSVTYKEKNYVFMIILILSLYAAMRTCGNDTTGYIKNFNENTPTLSSYFSTEGWKNDKGPAFTILCIVCKYCISDNYHVFFLISAFITNSFVVSFLRKHNDKIILPLFLYLAMDGYGTTLTGMRQAMATALAFWASTYIYDKKWIRYVIAMFIAFEIHFIAIIFLVVPFIKKNVWNGKVIIFSIIAVGGMASFDKLGELLLDTAEVLGREYSSSIIYGTTTINIFRVLVYWTLPISAFTVRRQLNQKKMIVQEMTNLSIVGALLVSLGLLGTANTFGRFGLALEESIYVGLPYTVDIVENNRGSIKMIMIICFFIYYLFGHLKNGIGLDYYGLAHIWEW